MELPTPDPTHIWRADDGEEVHTKRIDDINGSYQGLRHRKTEQEINGKIFRKIEVDEPKYRFARGLTSYTREKDPEDCIWTDSPPPHDTKGKGGKGTERTAGRKLI